MTPTQLQDDSISFLFLLLTQCLVQPNVTQSNCGGYWVTLWSFVSAPHVMRYTLESDTALFTPDTTPSGVLFDNVTGELPHARLRPRSQLTHASLSPWRSLFDAHRWPKQLVDGEISGSLTLPSLLSLLSSISPQKRSIISLVTLP